MDTQFKLSDSLGDIVARFPLAAEIFIKKQIDFCCGGDRSLETGIHEIGADPAEILAALEKAYEDSQASDAAWTDWVKASPVKLINHIVLTHHRYLKEALPMISELTFKILRVHGIRHPEIFKVHRNFNLLRLELESHMVKEEEMLFLAVKSAESFEAMGEDHFKALILELESEHEAAGDLLKSLRELTDHYSVPADGCTTLAVTYQKLAELEVDTFHHVHLENNILFKHVRQ
jgi:regulator of cell morphogenesis and NO signaling